MASISECLLKPVLRYYETSSCTLAYAVCFVLLAQTTVCRTVFGPGASGPDLTRAQEPMPYTTARSGLADHTI